MSFLEKKHVPTVEYEEYVFRVYTISGFWY